MSVDSRSKWKPVAITLAGAAALGFTCCFSGLASGSGGGGFEVFLLMLGAVAWLVFLVQLVVALMTLVVDLAKK